MLRVPLILYCSISVFNFLLALAEATILPKAKPGPITTPTGVELELPFELVVVKFKGVSKRYSKYEAEFCFKALKRFSLSIT